VVTFVLHQSNCYTFYSSFISDNLRSSQHSVDYNAAILIFRRHRDQRSFARHQSINQSINLFGDREQLEIINALAYSCQPGHQGMVCTNRCPDQGRSHEFATGGKREGLGVPQEVQGQSPGDGGLGRSPQKPETNGNFQLGRGDMHPCLPSATPLAQIVHRKLM